MSAFCVVVKEDCPHFVSSNFTNVELWSEFSPTINPFVNGHCLECKNTEENWLCLKCRGLFCSRYINSHNLQHFEENDHCLSVSLNDLSCWCSKCDSYVHSPDLEPVLELLQEYKFNCGNSDAVPQIILEQLLPKHDDSFTARSAKVDPIEQRRYHVNPDVPAVTIIYHDDCHKHNIPGHPEQPLRYTAIMDILREHYNDQRMFVEAPLVTEEQVLRFHTERLWRSLKAKCTESEQRYASLVGSSSDGDNAKAMRKCIVAIDGDTNIMPYTRNAMLRAAGGACLAVDMVVNARKAISSVNFNWKQSPLANSVFCCMRPPGHHAERDKAMGFCFLNNAGIAAKYAQAIHGLSRVAVLDFDVHHGNGTEEGFRNDPSLFYGSTHEKGNYPGTGPEPSVVPGRSVSELHRRIVNRFLPSGPDSRRVFREKWRSIITEMVIFKPDLIIFSAGFDAHDEDPLASCELIEEDYAWATEAVMDACAEIDAESPPPCISVLEGGYDIEALANSALAHVKALGAGYPVIEQGDEIAVLRAHMKELGIES